MSGRCSASASKKRRQAASASLALIAAGLGVPSKPRERAEVTFHPPGLPGLVEDVLDRGAKLCFGRLGVVALQDPGLRLRHLAERPEGDALAVRERASLPPGDVLGRVGVESGEELPDESALSDPGDADQCDELRGSVALRAGDRVEERVELVAPSDQRSASSERDVHPEAGLRRDGLPHRDGVRLALRNDRFGLAVLDGVLGQPASRLVDQDPVRRSRALQP